MKITLSKLFDADTVIKRFLEAKVQGIEDFVTAVSDQSDKLIQVLRNNVSIADNIDCLAKDFVMIHNQTLVIENPERLKQVKHITVTKAMPFANPVTSFAWAYNAKGGIDLKAQFLGAPTASVTVTVIMYF